MKEYKVVKRFICLLCTITVLLSLVACSTAGESTGQNSTGTEESVASDSSEKSVVIESVASDSSEKSAEIESFPADFVVAKSNAATSAMIRYWLPGAPYDTNEMVREIKAIAEVGFKGIELACVCDSGHTMDASLYGWGSEKWAESTKLVLETAKEVGLKVDLTVSAHWPLNIPGVTADSEASQKELQTGIEVIQPGITYEGKAPVCDTPLNEKTVSDVLKAVTVAKITGQMTKEVSGGFGSPSQEITVYVFDPTTMEAVDINADGSILWTAPAADDDYDAGKEDDAGKWAIISYWLRGSGQEPAGLSGFQYTEEPSFVVDHFSLEGTQAFIDYWNANILTDEIKELLLDVGGSIFEDSLEVSGDLVWTDQFLSYFEKHRGYDLTPYLPVLYGHVQDEQLTERIEADYGQTLNDMYIEYHLLPIKDYANSLGLNFRVQAYGGNVDSSDAGSKVDIIEGELLTFSGMGISLYGDNTEGEWIVNNKFRMLRGGANMGNVNVVSDEIGSLLNGDYALSTDKIIDFMNSDFAGGVNQVVLHGSPYKYFSGASWPTGATFSPAGSFGGFGVALSDSVPSWTILDESLDYINRTQYILQSGQSDVDVAIYRHVTSTSGTTLSDGTLVAEGYTYDYISPTTFTADNENAVVEDGVLAPKTASYKAMVIFDTEYMTLAGIEKVTEFAEQRLPVVIVGTKPDKTKGFGDTDNDSQVAGLVQGLLEFDNVRFVENESKIADALKDLGISPDTSFEQELPKLSTIHRRLDGADYYYLFNRGYEAAIEKDVTFVGEGVAYLLNAYTGKVTIAENFQDNGDGTVTVGISLDSRDAMLIVISSDPKYANGAAQPVVAGDESDVIKLDSWSLSLESWEPASEDVVSKEVVTNMEDLSRFDTNKITTELKLDKVIPWSDMVDYANTSGIGTYVTTVNVNEEVVGRKAILNLGIINNGYELYVNGKQVYGNLVTKIADLTEDLIVGENEIKVVVPSEVMNTLITVRPDVYGNRDRGVYGLTEAPVLTFY